MENSNFNLSSVIKWYYQTFEMWIDNVFFWFLLFTGYIFVFLLSNNIIYHFIISSITFFYAIYSMRLFYSGVKDKIDKEFILRNLFFALFCLFFSFFTAYIFYLLGSYSRNREMDFMFFINSFSYTNPRELYLSNLHKINFDLFIYNLTIYPFYIMQILVISFFFGFISFLYPFFVWKKKSFIFSLNQSIAIQLKNILTIIFLIITFLFWGLLSFFYPKIIYPFSFLLFIGPIFFMWIDLIGEKKKEILVLKKVDDVNFNIIQKNE